MERGGGNQPDYSNEAEGQCSEEEKKVIEEFKEIGGDIDARVKVTKKRRSVSVRHLPQHKKNFRKQQSEMVEIKQQLADIYEVESYKEYNRLPEGGQHGEQTADELFY